MERLKSSLCRACNNVFPSSYYAEFLCPMCTRKAVISKVKDKFRSEHFFGASPAPFVGRFGYPHVNVGLLSPGETGDEIWKYDAPQYWASNDYSISEVVDFRASLLNSRQKSLIKGSSKVIDMAQEIAMSSRPVDVEVDFKKAPSFNLSFNPYTAPTGPAVEMEKAELVSNSKIHPKVEKVFSDTDLKAAGAMKYLYGSGFDVNFISKILSVATLGLKTNRRLVPTRFSITATDDVVGKSIINEIKNSSENSEYKLYFGSYLGNYFIVMMFPGMWSYELFEAYAKGDDFSTDYEPFSGRTTYAENCAGGYYAARLPILESLKEKNQQSSFLVIRMITDEYNLPLGVWVVREATRKAMQSKPMEFGSKELMLKYAQLLIERKFGYKPEKIFAASCLLSAMQQTRLNKFFKLN